MLTCNYLPDAFYNYDSKVVLVSNKYGPMEIIQKGKHGYGTGADAKHTSMAAEISNCQILVAGGMGQGAYESFKRAGLEVYLTDETNIQDVAHALIQNNLQNLASSRTD